MQEPLQGKFAFLIFLVIHCCIFFRMMKRSLTTTSINEMPASHAVFVLKKALASAPPKRSKQAHATYRNIVRRNMLRPFFRFL